MKIVELIGWLEEQYPSRAAESWDNVGLLVGEDTGEVSHVFLALDLTEKVLEEAVSAGADMIITHHPMIFSGMKKINNHTFTGRKIIRLIKEGIPLYVMHTNYDVLGMADLSADYLDLRNTEVLSVTEENADGKQGIGRVGELSKAMSLKVFAKCIKASLRLNEVKVYGELSRSVRKVAVCTGSGKSFIDEAIAAGADVYVTGDIDHHTGIDTVAKGMAIIDAGHYGTEYIFMDAVKEKIEKDFPQLKVTCAKVESPYILI